MRSLFPYFAAVVVLATTALGQFTINTPASVVQCLPVLLTWTGGTSPYYLSILPGNQPSAAPLVDLGEQTGTSFSWTANLAAGTSIGFTLRDSTGAIAQTAPVTIQNSTVTACIGQSPSTASRPATTGSTTGLPPVVTTTTAAGTTPRPVSSASPGGTGASRTSGAATSPTASRASASRMEVGFAGLLGAAILALVA